MFGKRSPTGTPLDIRRDGLTILHDPVDCKLDVVIIHGLNGAPYRTFCDERTGFFWPLELARTLPQARIMVFGYVADISAGATNTLGVYQHAEGLLLHLKNNRDEPEVGSHLIPRNSDLSNRPHSKKSDPLSSSATAWAEWSPNR